MIGFKRKLSAKQARERLAPGYEVLPVEVIDLLIVAGRCAYGPALGGNNSDLYDRVHHATNSAANVLNRYQARQAR